MPDISEVCTLSKPELEDRSAAIRSEILPLAVRGDASSSGFVIEFDHSESLQAKLENWVALERECCGSVAWKLSSDPLARSLRLEVAGLTPPDALAETLRALPAATQPLASPNGSDACCGGT